MWPGAKPGEEEDEADVAAEPASALDPARGRRSWPGCWSTGKKLHSFFSRMQLEHRLWRSSWASRQRIFRRRQWTAEERAG
jgi:hypothetical protein